MARPSPTIGVLRTGDVARFTGCCPRTVMGWTDAGLLKCWRIPASRRERRFEPRVVLAFLREHGMPVPDKLLRMCACPT